MMWRITLFLCLLAFPLPMLAGGTGPNSLQTLSSSDLIMVGTVTDGTSNAGGFSFFLSAVRVLKGEATPGTTIAVDWPFHSSAGTTGGPVPSKALSPVTGLWFLQKQAPGKYGVLPASVESSGFENGYWGPSPLQLPSNYTYSEGAALADKITLEIGAVVEAGGGIEPYLLDSNEAILDSFAPNSSQAVHRRWADSNSVNLQTLGLRGLIRQGDVSSLQTVANSLSSLSRGRWFTSVALDLRDNYRNPDPAGVQILGQLIATAEEGSRLQLGAAHALSSMHTRETLPILAGLLDSKVQRLRIEGANGLSSFANGRPMQTPANVVSMACSQEQTDAPYRTSGTHANDVMGDTAARDETRYIGFWKAWWTQMSPQLSH